MKLNFSEPVLVSMGPETKTAGWGPHQFPELKFLPNGDLFLRFNLGADSEAAYGNEHGCFFSSDKGKTWVQRPESEFLAKNGIVIGNGDRIRFDEPPSIPLDEETEKCLSGSLGAVGHVEHKNQTFYRMEDVHHELIEPTWTLTRMPGDKGVSVEEKVKLNWPHMVVRACRGVLVRNFPMGRIRISPTDGSLWMTHYGTGCDPKTGEFHRQQSNYLFRSTDHGHTWDLIHYLPFDADRNKEFDPLADKREGYGENDITFAPDGSMVKIIRSSGFYPRLAPSEHGPSYITRSTDGGYTWSDPVVFDDRGVWPTLCTLKCGVTIAGYGRPGFFIRATEDPACLKWEDRVELIHSSGEASKDAASMETKATCSYCDIVPLDDRTAGIAYSDFTQKDETGNLRKCMMFRTVTVVD